MNRIESAIKILDAQGAYCGQCSRELGDSLDACRDCAAVLETYAHALEAAGLLVPDARIIRTPEELGELALEDTDAVVLASEAGAARSVKALWEMCRAGGMWGLPAVVIATGEQVRAAREAMEAING